jgi:hypothetical protein
MKKFFEKDIVRFTFVLTVVSLACGLLIGAVNAITAPVIENNLLQAKLDAYESVLPGIESFTELDTEGDPGTIVDKIEGKDQDDNVLGYIFVADGKNKYGTMTIVLSVDAEGTILGATFSAIEQTYQVEDTRNNLALFVGTTLSDLTPAGDITTGATGSLNTVMDLLSDIATAYGNLDIPEPELPDDPTAALFDDSLGIAYTEDDGTFTSGSALVLWKKTAYDAEDNVIGSVYKLEGTGVKYDGEQGTIGLYVLLSGDGTILGYALPNAEYGHSRPGVHHSNNTAFLDSIVGDALADLSFSTDPGDIPDLVAGSSNTYRLLITMLEALNGEVES